MLRDILMILFVTCATIGGQLLLKSATIKIAAQDPVPKGIDWFIAAFSAPLVWGAILVQGVGFVVWLVVISRVKLGLAFAISGASLYILMAYIGWQFYDERLSSLQWLGIVMISTGVLMLSLLGSRP